MKHQTAKWVRKAEDDWEAARQLGGRKPPLRDTSCFHCQQAAEKYLKALLLERDATIPKIHDLERVLDLLLSRDATLAPLRRILQSLSRYAEDNCDQDMRATTRQMSASLRHAERVRGEARSRLGLPL
jgi:HEPN domain-containing protein